MIPNQALSWVNRSIRKIMVDLYHCYLSWPEKFGPLVKKVTLWLCHKQDNIVTKFTNLSSDAIHKPSSGIVTKPDNLETQFTSHSSDVDTKPYNLITEWTCHNDIWTICVTHSKLYFQIYSLSCISLYPYLIPILVTLIITIV
jgi:hypothetical protein